MNQPVIDTIPRLSLKEQIERNLEVDLWLGDFEQAAEKEQLLRRL